MEILYKESVEKDFRKIAQTERLKIKKKIETELKKNPGIDKQLSGDLKGLYSYRVGDYRVIYSIIKDDALLILRIRHRKDVYKE